MNVKYHCLHNSGNCRTLLYGYQNNCLYYFLILSPAGHILLKQKTACQVLWQDSLPIPERHNTNLMYKGLRYLLESVLQAHQHLKSQFRKHLFFFCSIPDTTQSRAITLVLPFYLLWLVHNGRPISYHRCIATIASPVKVSFPSAMIELGMGL